jgi:hypothetical protein
VATTGSSFFDSSDFGEMAAASDTVVVGTPVVTGGTTAGDGGCETVEFASKASDNTSVVVVVAKGIRSSTVVSIILLILQTLSPRDVLLMIARLAYGSHLSFVPMLIVEQGTRRLTVLQRRFSLSLASEPKFK